MDLRKKNLKIFYTEKRPLEAFLQQRVLLRSFLLLFEEYTSRGLLLYGEETNVFFIRRRDLSRSSFKGGRGLSMTSFMGRREILRLSSIRRIRVFYRRKTIKRYSLMAHLLQRSRGLKKLFSRGTP